MIDICIVSPSYLSTTPRPVKEADALHAAGFSVRVVFVQGSLTDWRARDDELQRKAPWRSMAVRFSRSQPRERALWLKSAVRQRALDFLPKTAWRRSLIAERAEGRLFSEIAAAAAAEPARMYIGHLPYGLAAAAWAARRHQARISFDAEDFHSAQGGTKRDEERAAFIQRRYLPRCAYITAASTGIANALEDTFGVKPPLAIHNVFPWRDRQTIDGLTKDRRGSGLSLYWYSQTVGLDRGIDDAIRAAGALGGDVQLHIRGVVSDSIRSVLQQLAVECGIGERIFFHPPVSPNELLSRAVEHDVGLALEQPVSLNREIAASNKMFFYLLAGLAVAATDIPGQRSVLGTAPEAARLYSVGRPEMLAKQLDPWRSNKEALDRAKRAALDAARRVWNWELESEKLVGCVREALEDPLSVQHSSDGHECDRTA